MNSKEEKSPKTKPKRSIWKILLWGLLFLLLILLIGVFVAAYLLNSFLQDNKTKIIDNLEFFDNATLSFDKTSVQVFKSFPKATIILENFYLLDSLYDEHQRPILHADKLTAILSLKEWRTKSFEIQTIKVKDGQFNLLVDDNGYNNLKSIIKEDYNKYNSNKKLDVKVDAGCVKLLLSNFDINITDSVKTTSILGTAKELSAIIKKENIGYSANIDMDVDMEEMAFKKGKGHFLANSNVQGVFDMTWQDSLLLFKPFDVVVNGENYYFEGKINTNLTTTSKLTFISNATKFDKVLPILPKQIQEKIRPYKIRDPFYSKTIVYGTFKRDDPPIVNVDFKLFGNEVIAKDLRFEKTTAEGRFINRLYDDQRAKKEGKKNLRIELKDVTTTYDRMNLQSNNTVITVTPETKSLIKLDLKVDGVSSKVSSFLDNDQFFFENGSFTLETTTHGPLNNTQVLIANSDSYLVLNDFSVIYKPSQAKFPFQKLSFDKKKEDASFSILSSINTNDNEYSIKGRLTNVTSLLVDTENEQVTSTVDFEAQKISWTDFVDLFGEKGVLKSDQLKSDIQKKKTMKETVKGIELNFKPKISIKVDTLIYYDVIHLTTAKTGLHFEGDTLVLEQTSFNLQEGNVNFSSRLDLTGPYLTPFDMNLSTKSINLEQLLPPLNFFNIKLLQDLGSYPQDLSLNLQLQGIIDDTKGIMSNTTSGNIKFESTKNQFANGTIEFEPIASAYSGSSNTVKSKIHLNGDPSLFNDFFKTEQFIFEKGNFHVNFEYTGDITSINQLLTNSKATLKIKDSEVFFKTANVSFPLTKVDLSLKNDQADFKLYLRSDSLNQELFLDGTIDHLSELVIGNTGKELGIDVDLSSPSISWKNVFELFPEKDSISKKEQKITVLKKTVKGLLNKFNPRLNVDIQEFIYSDLLRVSNLRAIMEMLDSNTFALHHAGVDFEDGSLQLYAKFDLQSANTPFVTTINTKDINLAAILKSLEYLSIESLENAKKLDGQISMLLNLSGTINEEATGLIKEQTEGTLSFDLQNIEVEGLNIIDSIANKVVFKKRFKDIKFAPISSQITIRGNNINIPRTQIQSNAINLFVEGDVMPDDQTNVWISIPIDNLEKRDLSTIPDKREYALTGGKVFLEVTTVNGQLKLKIYLSKRKFYEKRGILPQFRIDKKKNRILRRQWYNKQLHQTEQHDSF